MIGTDFTDLAKLLAESMAEGRHAVAPDEKETVTADDVTQLLKQMYDQGHVMDIKALLEKHGVSSVSEMNPDEYASIYKEATGLLTSYKN